MDRKKFEDELKKICARRRRDFDNTLKKELSAMKDDKKREAKDQVWSPFAFSLTLFHLFIYSFIHSFIHSFMRRRRKKNKDGDTRD